MSLRTLLGAFVRELLREPSAPSAPTIRHMGEMQVQLYETDAPDLGAPDVVSRKFHLEVDGVDAVTVVAKDLPLVVPFKVEDGKAFKIWFSDIDDAGNESPFNPANVTTGTAVDDIAPASPNAPNVRHVGEE
jgi:hypothetical protein